MKHLMDCQQCNLNNKNNENRHLGHIQQHYSLCREKIGMKYINKNEILS